jgi:hypothetical protein
MAGDRVAFFPADGSGRFIVLENLNLQRVVQMITENPVLLDWKVSGTITEYRGSNFLFLRSAVVQSRGEVHEDVR